MDLLLKLDSVQGGYPMIRDGRRSISRDLVNFLEFIDGISVKRQQISSKTTRNVRFQSRDQGGSQKVLDKLNQIIQGCYKVFIDDENDTEEEQEEEQGEIEDLHPIDDEQENSRNPNYGILLKRPNVSVKSKKNVRFADNEGNVSIGSNSSQDSDVVSIGGGGGNDQRQFVENLSRNAGEIIGGSHLKFPRTMMKELPNPVMPVKVIDFHQTLEVNGIRFWCYTAGHGLGAAMFMVDIAGVRVLYMGDYSREEDRHPRDAETLTFSPDICIIESTYGVQLYQSRIVREKRFTEVIHSTIAQGGRVLIPAFALGCAQELLLILDEYWVNHPELHNIPIYYASPLAKSCMVVYQTYINSMNDRISVGF